MNTQTTFLSLSANIGIWYERSIAQRSTVAARNSSIFLCYGSIWIIANLILDFIIYDRSFDPRLVALLLAQPPRVDQRRLDGIRRVGTSDGSRPLPGDHRVLGPVGRHGLRVKMTDSAFGLVAHPLPVVADVLGEAFSALIDVLLVSAGMHGLHPRELRGDLDECLVDEHGQRVEVAGVSLQAEALRLQRDRPASRERVENRGELAAVALADLLAGLAEQLFVIAVLPHHQSLHEGV